MTSGTTRWRSASSGKLENLPKRVKAYIDPEAELLLPAVDDDPPELVQNLRIFADNEPGEKLNLRNLDISVVKDDDPDPTKSPLVLIAEGNILGLPELVMGTIHMPVSEEDQAALPDDDPLKFDKPAFDIVATPPLDEVDVQVRNFVAPDVMPPVAPARDGATPDQSISFQQRGDFFKAVAKIKDVAGRWVPHRPQRPRPGDGDAAHPGRLRHPRSGRPEASDPRLRRPAHRRQGRQPHPRLRRRPARRRAARHRRLLPRRAPAHHAGRRAARAG